MHHIRIILVLIVALLLAAAASARSEPIFFVQNQFGDSLTCDMMAQGIFLVWWDSQNDLSEEAAILLDSMMHYRSICLDSLELQDPQNTLDGYYFNVYLHEQGDVFPDSWACGVGTNMWGYPYMTLPIGILGNWMTISHESSHVFQWNSDAPGFDGDDVFWFIEASANWFAAINYPEAPNAFLEIESLVRLPQVAMWLGYDNFPEYYPENWQRYVHQYAMSLFLFYLTEEVEAPYYYICGGFYNNGWIQDLLPQEYLYALLGGDEMRGLFMDWAAHMTNDFDFILPSQRETAENEWNTYADPADDNEFVQVYLDSGSGGWYSPPDSLTTAAWSFNTYKIHNSSSATYSFHLLGDSLGSEGGPALFRGMVLVRDVFGGASFYPLPMTSEIEGDLSVEVTQSDTTLYLIVGSLPDVFEGAEQIFDYQVDITRDATGIEEGSSGPLQLRFEGCSPNPFCAQTSIGFDIEGPSGSGVTVLLSVFDSSGRRVRTLANTTYWPGHHMVPWDGRDDSGRRVPDGVYFLLIQAGEEAASGRIVMLR